MTEFVQDSVAENAEHAITNLRTSCGELAVGNVLRRTCQYFSAEGCNSGANCGLIEDWKEYEHEATSRERIVFAMSQGECADLDLRLALNKLRLSNRDVLIVGVTSDRVGFADELDEYGDALEHPYGWRELTGFNAFFAREGETDALGRRLADCADINFAFQDRDGNTVFGFQHGTRTNMFGSSRFAFEKDGKKMSFTEYVLREAIEHYGADPTTINIKLAAAIKGHNFTKHFDGREKMEEHLPGWYDDGFVLNVSNPDWQPGNPVVPEDTWEADTRGMITRDIKEAMKNLGIPGAHLNAHSVIDPGDSKGGHSSHQFAADYGDTRDLYITYVK